MIQSDSPDAARPSSGAPRFDLIDIAQALNRRRGAILLITGLAIAVGLLTYFISPRKYKATAEVFIANPLYADRNLIFPTGQLSLIDYFGDEDMIDKALVIGESESARAEIIRRQDLARAYKVDTSDKKKEAGLHRKVSASLKLSRTEYGNLEITYTDTDPKRAANVANEAVRVLENIYHSFYSDKRGQVVTALKQKSAEADSAIAVLTDSLIAMRERYGIYEILSPNRAGSMMNSSVQSRSARGIEEVQNVESLKDQWVIDRARSLGIINEMNTGLRAGQTPIVHVLSGASVPTTAAGAGFILTMLGCAFAGFFFSALWVLVSTYFGKLVRVQR